MQRGRTEESKAVASSVLWNRPAVSVFVPANLSVLHIGSVLLQLGFFPVAPVLASALAEIPSGLGRLGSPS